MYIIQAHNVVFKRIDVFKTYSMHERDQLLAKLKANQDYGLIDFEHIARFD